ncbi:uncharacterized protein I303_102767 [Kwoniella dejecticola CBS 10117]|uniref:Uncharacterized protein n=1 Tax=Kwoniella dejecticola CBS 10117 TaxID=1296121 RepID=A0A1A6A9N7_9TREE|nr:uncharacterized protein I303_02781 [Kwoniella dejecticola CBS 10117]OBR86766.1 hypothetical protein I303_02781 [Kwoniella dejecticola CBS 10117]
MAPLDVGGAIGGIAETAIGGAGGAAKTAAGAVSTATNAVNKAKGQYDDAKGMLGMFNEMQGYITKIQDAWEEYQYLIIFVGCLIILIYVSAAIYCCFHFMHDFFRCACCCVSCTYKCERYLWKHRGPTTDCLCRPCKRSSSKGDKDKDKGKEKAEYHRCSKMCLWFVPRSTRMDLEKQHGDLRKGWFDATYCARGCGRSELPNDPDERLKWHWYGHERSRTYRVLKGCAPHDRSTKKAVEYEKEEKREKYWRNLVNGKDKLGDKAGSWKDRVPLQWAKDNEKV